MKLILASLIALFIVCWTFPVVLQGEPMCGIFPHLTYVVVTHEESSNDR